MHLSCHCGNIKLTVNQPPETLTSCNCSMCHRYGSLWGYYEPKDVTIETASAPTETYRWGDEDLDFHRCPTCGCIMFWRNTENYDEERVAANFRMADRKAIESIPVRKFDGADTWQFIDE